MENEKKHCEQCGQKCKHNSNQGVSSGVYGLAFVGALVYYLQNATSLWIGVVGIFKAILWPAFLIYKLLGFLKM